METESKKCFYCDGEGRTGGHECPFCKGKGFTYGIKHEKEADAFWGKLNPADEHDF